MRAGLAWHRGKGLVPPRERPDGDQRPQPKGVLLEAGQSLGQRRLEVHVPELAGGSPKVGQMLRKRPAGRLISRGNTEQLG
ncbi:MAG: hypothetical protein JRD92_19010 [Deltaproteobacteria bacterium]|nr:hypothetical protein [Deltaproteobacteria bacterium]